MIKAWITSLFLCFGGLLFGQLPDGFVRVEIADQLNPAKMAVAPDGRIFLTEKHGSIRILRDDKILPAPFLEIEVDQNNERGLSGIVFDPNFESNNYIYIYYTVPGRLFNRISRITANGDLAVPGSEKVIFELDRLHSDVHNGGSMHFGFDGKLYVTVGDSGIPWWAASKEYLLGKVLRINKDGSIPEDNPFYNEYEGKKKAIYASGFRNPFTSAMHPITGAIYVNDVGNSTWEEINELEAGAFYGWGTVEGFLDGQDVPDNYKDPLYVYRHTNGCAIVGSTVYEPEQYNFPEKYWGKYFFVDYCKGQIRVFDLEQKKFQETFMFGGNRVINVMTHPDGSMYYLERRGAADGSPWDNTATAEGALFKVSYTGSGAPFVSIQPKDQFVVQGEPASFTVAALGAGSLTYQWYKNNQIVSGATDSILQVNSSSVADSNAIYHVEIENALGVITSDQAKLLVTTNQRPIVDIRFPESGQTYIAGTEMTFEGSAMDPESGLVADENLWWKVDFMHDQHAHPALPLTRGISKGAIQIPTIGEIDTNVFYRIFLIAEDASGLRQSTFVDVHPEKSRSNFKSLPSGLAMSRDGILEKTPFGVTSVKGITRTVEAPLKQIIGDSIYVFKFWANGQDNNILTYQAGFENENGLIAEYDAFLLGYGNGLTASFYDNDELEGQPVLIEQDSVIDYLFHSGPPREGLPKDNFSIRWKGYLLPYKTGKYTFDIHSDDGIRFSIGDELLIDAWTGGGHFEQATIFLEGNKLYPIEFDYQEQLYGAFVSLRWSSEDFAQEVIPMRQMYGQEFLNPQASRAYSIVPNPANSEFNLKVYTEERKNVSFTLTDMLGRIVFQSNERLEFGENRIPVSLRQMTAGVYQVAVRGEDGRLVYEDLLVVQ